MILKVFKNIGDTFHVADAYKKLAGLYKDPYSKQKAAGSLGGSINGGTLIRDGNLYTRIK